MSTGLEVTDYQLSSNGMVNETTVIPISSVPNTTMVTESSTIPLSSLPKTTMVTETNTIPVMSPMLQGFSSVYVTSSNPKKSSEQLQYSKILSIVGGGYILDNGLDNVSSVGLMSLPDDTSSFFSDSFTIVSDREIIFDVNDLVGINGFSFANYNGIEFAVVLKDRMGYLSYATPNALYLVNTNI